MSMHGAPGSGDQRALRVDPTRFARATFYANTAAPELVEHELQVFRGQCVGKNGDRKTFFKLAGGALAFGLLTFLIGANTRSPELQVGGAGLGLVLLLVFLVMGATVAPYRDERRLAKISDLLRSLDLAPGLPASVGVDFLELREEPHMAAAPVVAIAQLPKPFVIGRPWCTARATLANGLEISLVRSARTHTYTRTSGSSSTVTYSYWLVDAVAVSYDPQRFPAIAAAGASVQRQIVIPSGWEPVTFFAGPGTIAVCAITQHKFLEPDYNPRGALDLARQLTQLVDPSRAVVSLAPQRAPDPIAETIGAKKAPSGPSPLPSIAMAVVGLIVAGLSTLNLAEKATSLPRAMDAVVADEKGLKAAKDDWWRGEMKRNLANARENEAAEIQATALSGGLALLGLGIGGVGGWKLLRRRKARAAPTSVRAIGAPARGS